MASEPLILVLQHAESETMGLIEPLCRDLKIAWHVCRPYAGEAIPPGTQPYHGLVALGGPMNVDETGKFPRLADEVKLLQSAFRRHLPVLGVCLGAQLMAKAAGAAVRKGEQGQELGWFPIRVSDAGRQDPLLAGLPEAFMVFHWHGDTYELPAKAVHLASSALYAQQAFRLGEEAYALQFHVEVTPDMVERWVRESPGLDGAAILAGLSDHGPAVTELGRTILTRFLQKIVALEALDDAEERPAGRDSR